MASREPSTPRRSSRRAPTTAELRDLLDALEREDATLMGHAKREFAGLSTLIEQVRVLLDMISALAARG